MNSLPSYLVTFTIFSLPSQTSRIRMPAEALLRVENEICDSCTEELLKNGGCGILLEDSQRVKDILYLLSNWCTTNCHSTLYTGCQRYCTEENNQGCNYRSCCTDFPLAVCYTEECVNLYGYCCDPEFDTWMKVSRRVQGAVPPGNTSIWHPVAFPSSDPSIWYPVAFPSSDPSNLDDSNGTELPTALPTPKSTNTTLLPIPAPTSVTTLSPTQTTNPTSQTSLAPTAAVRTVEPTRSPKSLPTPLPTTLPTSMPSPVPTYLRQNITENTTFGVGDFCINNSDCVTMTCVEMLGGIEQKALADDESCSAETCRCGLASHHLQLEWVLQLCCIEEAHINHTIQPIAESLNISDSAVRIKSYHTPSLKEQRRLVFAWDIIYEVRITGDALALNQKLYNETFLDTVGTAIEESIGFSISKIATLNLYFYVATPTSLPTEFLYNETNVQDQPDVEILQGSDNFMPWTLAGVIGGILLLTGLTCYISLFQTAAEEPSSSEDVSNTIMEEVITGVPIRLGEGRFEL